MSKFVNPQKYFDYSVAQAGNTKIFAFFSYSYKIYIFLALHHEVTYFFHIYGQIYSLFFARLRLFSGSNNNIL